MEIDIRNRTENMNNTLIRYSDTEHLCFAPDIGPDMDQKGVKVFDEVDCEEFTFYMKDVDNLIKALQKAKEIWDK